MPLNIKWSLCYNFIYVYFIKFLNEKIGLNTILTSQFQTYLFPTSIIPKFLKFCNWCTINLIESSIVSKWNVNKIWIYFLMFLWKNYLFLNLIFFCQFFCIFYHVWTLWPSKIKNPLAWVRATCISIFACHFLGLLNVWDCELTYWNWMHC
jgi:hypothetical protein